MKRCIFVLMTSAMTAAAFASTAQAQAPALRRVQFSVGGGMHAAIRSYSYYVSSHANHNGYNPVVYAFHDDGQTAEQFAQSSGWIKLAEDNAFVVVFPEARNKTWSPFANDEDAYLRTLFDSTLTQMVAEAATGDRRRAGPAGGEGGGAPPGAGRGGDGPAAALRGQPGMVRIGSWQPWQYVAGAGSGARIAQEFAINHPGLVAAVATLNAKVYPASFARGNASSDGEFQNQIGLKTNPPQYRPAKKDVPVAAWLFTAGVPDAGQTRLTDYWKHSDAVASAAQTQSIDGFQTAVYASPQNPAQQVRVTALPAGTAYDGAVAAASWEFFSHTARWTSSPDGRLGTMMPLPEVRQTFEERHARLGDQDYLYWVKTPSSYRKGQSLPLVICLHGGGYPAWMYLSQIKMHEVGEKEGFITVYINGPGNAWNFDEPDSDSALAIAQVIDEMAANYGADRGRVYLQGFSIGSGMTFVEGVTHPQLFAAVSPNSGLGDFEPAVMQRIAANKAQGLRIPMLVVYGSQDRQSSTDGLIPAEGVLHNVIDTMKSLDGITTADHTQLFQSVNTQPYEILLPGGKFSQIAPEAGYPNGRIQRYDYAAADGKPMFSWAWVIDMPHGQTAGEAQLEWDFFKSWRRNPDGSLAWVGH